MALVTTGMLEIKLADQTKEAQQFSIYMAEVTPANYAAALTAIGTFRTALDGIVNGVVNKEAIIARRQVQDPPLVATDPTAQREMNWLIVYQDNVNFRRFTFRIPTPDMAANLRVANSDRADLTATAWADWKTAFEAFARSEDNNAVTLLAAFLVGRNDRSPLPEI